MTVQLLTAEQLAERWQVPTSQVYRLTRDGQIPALKLGRYVDANNHLRLSHQSTTVAVYATPRYLVVPR